MLTKWEFCRATGKIYEFEKDVILDNLLDQILVELTKGEHVHREWLSNIATATQRQELM